MPTDRGIIFSAPMIEALLADRKTQTRRLATSPLRRCQIGDRLWVRETHAYVGTTDPGWLLYRASGYKAECKRHGFDKPYPPEKSVRWTPAIHMKRTASRLTLIVTDVRFQRLQDITEADCLAEGPRLKGYAEFGRGVPSSLDGPMVHTDQDHVYATPRCWYRELWGALHTEPGQRWDDNPEIVALSFIVRPGNIDRVGP